MAKVELLVCRKCKAGRPIKVDATTPGSDLLEALQKLDWPSGLDLRATDCLSNCDNGCSIALRGPNRWTFVYGNLDAQSHTQTIYEGACKYLNAADGLVPWRERPAYFRKNCIARVPPLQELTQDA